MICFFRGHTWHLWDFHERCSFCSKPRGLTMNLRDRIKYIPGAVKRGLDMGASNRGIIECCMRFLFTGSFRKRNRLFSGKYTIEALIMESKRYSVLAFPSYLGTPICANSYLWSRILCIWRSLWFVDAMIQDAEEKKYVNPYDESR